MSMNDMTEAEQTLADDKARAEIANLNALTAKLVAETIKVNSENRWYPLVLGTGLAGVLLTAGVAMAKLLFGASFLRFRMMLANPEPSAHDRSLLGRRLVGRSPGTLLSGCGPKQTLQSLTASLPRLRVSKV